MSRYTDVDALLHDLCTSSYPQDVDIGKAYYIFRKELRNAPTADVVPVVHGYWIERTDYVGDTYYDCSACGESWTTIEGDPCDNGMNYCPNCGAKMDEVVE